MYKKAENEVSWFQESPGPFAGVDCAGGRDGGFSYQSTSPVNEPIKQLETLPKPPIPLYEAARLGTDAAHVH
jgi:hypothetical protein